MDPIKLDIVKINGETFVKLPTEVSAKFNKKKTIIGVLDGDDVRLFKNKPKLDIAYLPGANISIEEFVKQNP